MALLDGLPQPAADRLWWTLLKAIGRVADEIDALSSCPAQVRDLLYGRDVLGSYRALRDDLADLLDNDLTLTADQIAPVIMSAVDDVFPAGDITREQDLWAKALWSLRVRRG